MKNKKMIALMWGLCLVPAVLVLAVWGSLPDTIPSHWNMAGEVDAYGSKNFLWLSPAVTLVVAPIFQFLPRIDPKKTNYEKFQKVYDGFGLVFPLLMTGMTALVITETLRPGTLDVGRVVMVFVSLMFIVVGCIMGKIKPNWFMGIRTPWALADPDVWTRTHRLGGWVFFLCGLISLPSALLLPSEVFFWIFFGLLVGGILLVYIMSYLFYKRKNAGEEK